MYQFLWLWDGYKAFHHYKVMKKLARMNMTYVAFIFNIHLSSASEWVASCLEPFSTYFYPFSNDPAVRNHSDPALLTVETEDLTRKCLSPCLYRVHSQ